MSSCPKCGEGLSTMQNQRCETELRYINNYIRHCFNCGYSTSGVPVKTTEEVQKMLAFRRNPQYKQKRKPLPL